MFHYIFPDFVNQYLHVCLESFGRLRGNFDLQINQGKSFKSNLLCTSLSDFSPFEWTPIDFAGKVCEAEMTYDRVSISIQHLQPQLISSHSADLLEIKQPSLWLCGLERVGGDRVLFWHCFDDISSWDLSSYASPLNGITRFSLSVYWPPLLSATWETQTTPHHETNDICQHLYRKTRVIDWHLPLH